MGTNYFWKLPATEPIILPTGETWDPAIDWDSPTLHIGKRSAAGAYCWNCRRTLCRDGEVAIHYGRSDWYDHCPTCGATKETESLHDSAVGMELGFAPAKVRAPTGVRSVSSFSWAQDPEMVGTVCSLHPDDEIIENEYGDLFTGRAFLDMLAANCPIQFTDSIGVWFS